MKRILIMAVTFIIVAAPSIAQVSIDRKVDSLLSIMTLDEKIGPDKGPIIWPNPIIPIISKKSPAEAELFEGARDRSRTYTP